MLLQSIITTLLHICCILDLNTDEYADTSACQCVVHIFIVFTAFLFRYYKQLETDYLFIVKLQSGLGGDAPG